MAKNLENFKNGFLNLALPHCYMIFGEPVMPELQRHGHTSWTVWDRWMFSYEKTIQDLVEWLSSKSLQVASVACGTAILYMNSAFQNKRLANTLAEAVSRYADMDATNAKRSIRLLVNCTDPQSVTVTQISAAKSQAVLKASLTKLFEGKCGAPSSIEISVEDDQTTARVNFPATDFAAAAVEMNGTLLDGDLVQIAFTQLATPPLLLCSNDELAIEENKKKDQLRLEQEMLASKLQKVASTGSDSGSILSRQGSRLSRADSEQSGFSIRFGGEWKEGDPILNKRWSELTEDEVSAAEALGYNPELEDRDSDEEDDSEEEDDQIVRWPNHVKNADTDWDEWAEESWEELWVDLSEAEQAAGTTLGFSAMFWPPDMDTDEYEDDAGYDIDWLGATAVASLERTMSQVCRPLALFCTRQQPSDKPRLYNQVEMDLLDMERLWRREIAVQTLHGRSDPTHDLLRAEAAKIYKLPGDATTMLFTELKGMFYYGIQPHVVARIVAD